MNEHMADRITEQTPEQAAYQFCLAQIEFAYSIIFMDMEIEGEENGKESELYLSMSEDLGAIQMAIDNIRDRMNRKLS